MLYTYYSPNNNNNNSTTSILIRHVNPVCMCIRRLHSGRINGAEAKNALNPTYTLHIDNNSWRVAHEKRLRHKIEKKTA